MPALSWKLALVMGLLAPLALAACGRKGALEPHPAQVLPQDASGKTFDPGPAKPREPFILDPLLN